ncbi:MAG: hypothetical protein OXC02_08825 [Rhodobacteraceae bacterium]|nr:hypothetical protein [Paracoccaceae bacterium]
MVIPRLNKLRRKSTIWTMIIGIAGLAAVVLWLYIFFTFFIIGSSSSNLLETRGFQLIFVGLLPVVAIFLVVEVLRINITLSERVNELKNQFRLIQTDIDTIHTSKNIRINDNPPASKAIVQFNNEPLPSSDNPPSSPNTPSAFEPILQEEKYTDNSLTLNTGPTLLDRLNIDHSTLVKALNLPDDDNDHEGYEAFELASKNDLFREVLTLSHGVLHSLARIGIYMDNLATDLGPFHEWQEMANNKVLEPNPNLGGAGTQKDISDTTKLLAEDQDVFEQSQAFYQKIEQLLLIVIPVLNEEEINGFANTRTIRAFLLFTRVFSNE